MPDNTIFYMVTLKKNKLVHFFKDKNEAVEFCQNVDDKTILESGTKKGILFLIEGLLKLGKLTIINRNGEI